MEALWRLLELLDRGGSAEQFAQVATSAGPDELADVKRATEAALRIRATLTQHRRREAELAALFDTASDLAKLRDTDGVLRAIVHRARMLLHTDVAYLSLNDVAVGQTTMRVTEGCTSALFQQVILGMGEGLGGLVGQTARPYATVDYLRDPRFEHTATIDAAVQDEGLVAILGVPLQLGSRVLGVLYAADRTPREYTTAEVALLGSLADHAAIALDAAQRMEEARSAHETIRQHNEAMRRAEDAHDRLSDLVLRGGGVVQVATALADVLRGGIVMHDAAGGELARVGVEPMAQPMPLVEESRTSGRAVAHNGIWVCAVLAGPKPLGSITLTGHGELGDADRRLFERASVVTALLLLLRQSVAETEDRVRGELVTDLLTAPDRDPAGLIARGKRLGVDLTAPHVVAVAHAAQESRHRLATAASSRVPRTSLIGTHADRLVLLVPGTVSASDLARQLGDALGRPVTVGVAGPAAGPADLAAAHAEAERCLRALLQLGQIGRGADLAGLGFVGVVLGDRADVDGYVRRTLGPVLDYDAERGSELIATLHAYFDSGGNLNRAKDVLHVHVNTVTQRLERVTALLGPRWREPEPALEVQLALRLARVIHGPDHPMR
ncbi:helix-turn-helix domain-containing protein [Kutzneria buriramensis]|uniref:GAF domain-containing protein n=1 Tax=Kutzneria buriramensis TaxID=1045776 RepID=A0A3E0HHA7_9PSEU|nr:helix-turn-helix domain-containing protein [Kutzneria buriramensis]REH45879.1 GAF domain-containing protein [Kutzneria buriramensis]